MTVEDFLGRYLSEPKSHVFFDPPEQPMTQRQFHKHLQENGIALNLKSRMLITDNALFINGEAYPVNKPAFIILAKLADNYMLPAAMPIDKETEALLYQWYLSGYLD
ncbi:winged helix domain-containing protein [Nitrosomonas sp. PY1]|uniref:winged helix domain-containing protein n=1 Tax=Nitrosomonas sp. PY1 TaxID=1803906 RepID=UPI00283AAB42|nr:winged helix domain-containing protein [Nitrosomonas sp. PY1]